MVGSVISLMDRTNIGDAFPGVGHHFHVGPAAPGGIWPAMPVLIGHWFPMRARARADSFRMANLAICSIITMSGRSSAAACNR
jgi:hypothetical protein